MWAGQEAEEWAARATHHRAHHCRLQDDRATDARVAIAVVEALPPGTSAALALARDSHAHVDALAVVRTELARWHCKVSSDAASAPTYVRPYLC